MPSTSSLLAFCSLALYAITGEAKCTYQCGSPHPSQYGPTNLAPDSTGLPWTKTLGYSPVDIKSICSGEGYQYQPSFHIIPAIPEDGEFTVVNFAAICPTAEERTLKLYNANYDSKALTERVSEVIPGTENIVGFFELFENIGVLTENTMFMYTVNEPVSAVELQWQYSMDGSSSFTGLPSFSLSHMVATYGKSIVFVPTSFSGSASDVKVVDTGFENALGYNLISKDMEAVYFCSEEGVHQVTYAGEITTISLAQSKLECSSMILSDADTLIVSATKADGSGSVLASIDTTSFASADVFVTYPEIIYGLSHQAWQSMRDGPIGLIAMTTNMGVQVVVDELVNYTRGDVYSTLDSPNALTSFPTISSGAEPVLFTSEGVLSYTKTQLVKFFSLNLGLASKGVELEFSDMGFVSSPLLLGNRLVVASTESGQLVLYAQCVRYKAGEEPPENACPIGELTDAQEDPYWMIILTAGSAGFAAPVLGYAYFKKSKTSMNQKEDDEEEEDNQSATSDYTNKYVARKRYQ